MRFWFERLEEGLVALLLAVMTIITFVQVIARYIFNYSFVWALELVSFLFAWLIFIGMAYGVRVGTHIGVDALVKSLGPRATRVVTALAAMLCIVYAVIIFIGSWRYVTKMYDVGILAQDMPVPLWVPRVVLPLGFGLLVIRFSEVLYRIVRGREVHLLADEAEEALKQQTEPEEPPQQGRP